MFVNSKGVAITTASNSSVIALPLESKVTRYVLFPCFIDYTTVFTTTFAFAFSKRLIGRSDVPFLRANTCPSKPAPASETRSTSAFIVPG